MGERLGLIQACSMGLELLPGRDSLRHVPAGACEPTSRVVGLHGKDEGEFRIDLTAADCVRLWTKPVQYPVSRSSGKYSFSIREIHSHSYNVFHDLPINSFGLYP